MRRSLVITLFILLSACAALYRPASGAQDAGGGADGKAAIEGIVRSLFDALQAKNLDAAMALWEEDAPRYAAFKRFVGALLGTGADYRYTDFAYSHWEVSDEQAIVRVRFQRVSRAADSSGSPGRLTVWNLQLVKRQGRWRLWDQSDAIRELAYYLLNEAPTKEVRAQLFQYSPDLMSPELVQGLNELADAEAKRGDYAEAQRISGVAFEAAALLGDERHLAQTYEVRGLIFHRQRAYEGTLENSLPAANLYRAARDARGEARVLNLVGQVYAQTGRYEEALAALGASAKLRRPEPDKGALAGTLINIGEVYREMGRYADALSSLNECLTLVAVPKYNTQRAEALNNIGIIYRQLGRYEEALAQFAESLSLKRALGDRAGEARTLDNIGIAYSVAGDYVEAVSKFKESLEIKRMLQGRDASGLASALINLGVTYRAAGRYTEALAALDEALGLAVRGGSKRIEAIALGNLGDVFLTTRRYAEALDREERALALAALLDSPDLSVGPYASIGLIHRQQGRMRQAADAYRNAVGRVELLRERTEESNLQISFFQQYVSAYYGLADCLLTLGSKEEAFAVSESAKARTLVELLTTGGVSPAKGLSAAERQRERQLRGDAVAAAELLNTAQAAPEKDTAQIASLRNSLERARAAYEEFRRQLFIAHRELQAQRAQFDPASLLRLNQTLFAEEPRLCLLSYLVSREKVILFAITKGGGPNAPARLSAYTLKGDGGTDLTGDRLADLLKDFRRRYSNESGIYKLLAGELYRLLVAPAEGELSGKTHLVIIPDGILNTLPFQILVDGQGKHLIETRSISYAPSATALIEMLKLADRKRWAAPDVEPMLVMGRRTFPDQAEYRAKELPWAKEQAEAIARFFRVRAFTDGDATKRRALAEMENARYVHFATHGEVNDSSPMYSAIILGKDSGDDGMLYARDLADLSLKSELVVLSACETGLGRQTNGEGILGLTWSLFVAGTPSSIVSQWSVPADSTRDLMVKFYEPLSQSGAGKKGQTGKAEALRQAQLSLLRSPQYSHAYHWGAFVLVGDWR